MLLDYVSSGNSSLKFYRDNTAKMDNAQIDAAKAVLRGLSTKDRRYSVLFNAYTEENIGASAHNFFRDVVHSVHADSGGLQMITLGKSVTEAEKKAIYDIQAKYSDVAMCFDVIPITSSAQGKTGITDMSVRYFDHALVPEKARETGGNLKAQILRFKELGSTAKPMLIMQGNCIQSFQDWVDYACDELGDLVSDVHGISVAGTSLGGGQLEDVVRAAASTILKFPKELNTKNIHILGLGAPARFLPYVPFKELLIDSHVSFDSTTHAHAIFKGMLVEGTKSLQWDKMRYPEKERIVAGINALVTPYTDLRVTVASLEAIYIGSIKYEQMTGKLGVNCEIFIFTTVATFAYMISECLNVVEALFAKGKTYTAIASKRGGVGLYNELSSVRDVKDFNEWYGKYAKYLKSDQVRSSSDTQSSLEDYFG